MKKIIAAVASLTLLAAPLAASAQSFGHGGQHGGGYSHGGGQHYGGGDHRGGYGRGGYGGGYYGHDRGYGYGGAALAAGAFGLVVGSALASQSYGYDAPYGYAQPYGYEGDYGCYWQNRAYRDGYGNLEYRQVQICR